MYKSMLKPIAIAVAAIIPSLSFALSYTSADHPGKFEIPTDGSGTTSIEAIGTQNETAAISATGVNNQISLIDKFIELSVSQPNSSYYGTINTVVGTDNSSIIIGEGGKTESVSINAIYSSANIFGLYSISGIGQSSIKVDGASIAVNAQNDKPYVSVSTVSSKSQSNITIGSESTRQLNLQGQASNALATVVYALGSTQKETSTVDLHGKSISITGKALGTGTAFGIFSNSYGQVLAGDTETDSITITATDQASGLTGMPTVNGNSSSGIFANQNANIDLFANKSILIETNSANASAYGIAADNGGKISLNGGEGLDINISAKSGNDQNLSAAIFADKKGSIDIKANTLTVYTNGTDAILAQNVDKPDSEEETASIAINANKTTVTAENGSAISAFSYSHIEINGDLEATGKSAIVARGDSTIDINKAGTGTVVLNGDIRFQAGDVNSGNSTNANVKVVLSGADSVWNGNVVRQYNKADADKSEVTGLHVTLADGAVWNADSFPSDENDTVKEERTDVDLLTLNNGVINIVDTGDGTTPIAEIATLNGTGGTVNIAAKTDSAGNITTGQLLVKQVESSGDKPMALDVTYDGIDSDDLTKENSETLAGITGEGAAAADITEHVKEGDIRGAWTRSSSDESTAGSFVQNTKLESFKGVNAASLVQWRNQVNHLTKRLGDVRLQQGDAGAWARVYGGEYKWGDANHVDMTSTTVQAGGDARGGDWIIGGAFSYSDSSFDLDNGDGDGDLYTIALYGSRMFEKGSYIDFVARYGYIKNDFKAGNMGVSLDSNAFGLSVETGHTFKFMERAYVEPQIEVSYGYAQGDDAIASNGVLLEQDDYQNLITRIGLRTGFDFPENAGTIYAHVSYSYDFLGDADGTASKDGMRTSLSEDLGGGWVTYGIGGQFCLGQSTFAYGELERSTGGDVENPWAFNIGVRHLF